MSDAVKRQLDSNSRTEILCEQCALIRASESEIEALHDPEPDTVENAELCATCAALKEQEEAAARELARYRGLPDAEDVYRKWAHLFNARWSHRFKAHNSESRGRE